VRARCYVAGAPDVTVDVDIDTLPVMLAIHVQRAHLKVVAGVHEWILSSTVWNAPAVVPDTAPRFGDGDPGVLMFDVAVEPVLVNIGTADVVRVIERGHILHTAQWVMASQVCDVA
jgi:hypothetical protein